jgi:general secretion pathway protein D
VTSKLRALLLIAALSVAKNAPGQDSLVTTRGDSVSIRIVDVDLRQAVQMLSQYLDRPVVFGALTSQNVTIQTPRPIARSQVLGLLRTVLENQNHELVEDSASGVFRVRMRERTPPPSTVIPRQAPGVPELFVIHLSHARASDVAATVNALYGKSSALGDHDTPPQTLSNQLRQNISPPTVPANQPAAQPGAPAAARPATLQGDIVIVPDQGTNSLLIRASRPDYELIQAVVQQVDVRPLQVLIEVTIAELRRDRDWVFGVSTELTKTTVGHNGTTISGSIQGAEPGDFVLRVMNIGGTNLNALLSASAARGDAKILSRPVVLAANNEEAQISVGSQRPFIQVSRSLPTDTPTRDQVVQYKDVGTSLTVRPTISSNGFVTLELTQEVNAATTETAFDAPVISTRSLRTQLLVRDSQTVVLGGLSDTQRETTRSGVPFLSDIPILGALFGRQERRTTSTELFLFLTPRILRTDEDVDRQTDRRRPPPSDADF